MAEERVIGGRVEPLPPVLITSLCATGVAVARALWRHGVTVYGTDVQFAAGRFSKYVSRPDWGFETEVGERLLDTLVAFARRLGQRPVLLPTNDVFIEFVGVHYDSLKDHYIMQRSLHPSVSRQFLNKRVFSDLCRKHGIVCPRTLYLSGDESAADVADQMRFPMILKPHLIHTLKRALGGKKVVFVENYEELSQTFKTWRACLKNMLVQEFVDGPESNIWIYKGYFDRNGNPLDSFTGRKLRQYPPVFGSACLAQSAPNEAVARISNNFLKEIHFSGLCGTEFKYDRRDREYKMIEINIRPQTWDDLMRVAGKEILWMAYCDLADCQRPDPCLQANDVKWVYLTRDIAAALWQKRQGRLTLWEWLSSYRRISTDALLDRLDLRMLLGVPFYSLYQLCQYRWIRHR